LKPKQKLAFLNKTAKFDIPVLTEINFKNWARAGGLMWEEVE